jgi:hypothetical protein
MQSHIHKNKAGPVCRAMTIALLASPAVLSAQFSMLASLEDVRNSADNATVQNFIADGSDLIVALGGTSQGGGVWQGHAINRVSGIGGTPVVTNLMDSAAFGSGFFSPIHSFGRTGDILQFGATGLDGGVYQFDLGSNTLSQRFSLTQMRDLSGAGNLTYIGASWTDASGEFWFANARSGDRSLNRSNGTGIDQILDQTALEALFTGGSNATINAMAAVGNQVFMANNSSNSIGVYNAGDMSTAIVLDEPTILGVAGGTSITISRLYGAPNGMVYFSTPAEEIFSFDPANPAGTLALEFITGDNSMSVQAFGWYEGELAFATTSGIYAVPEPSAYAAIVGLLAVALVWRRRR